MWFVERQRNCTWVLFFWKSSCKHFYKANQGESIAQVKEDSGYDEIWRAWFKGGNVETLIKPSLYFFNVLKLLIFEFGSFAILNPNYIRTLDFIRIRFL